MSLQAAWVDNQVTQRVAVNFWNMHRPQDAKCITVSNLETIDASEYQYLDIYSVDGVGFMVVSKSDYVVPVLAYSYDSPASNELHASVREWLDAYDNYISLLQEVGAESSDEVRDRWQRLLDETDSTSTQPLITIPAMLTTKWDQSDPFNRLCPYDDNYNTKAVVGCVATAMAQLMKYWNYPSFGDSSHTYTHRNYANGQSFTYGNLSADFSQTTYMWDYMGNSLYYGSNNRSINAIATLSYHCGVAVDMMYGTTAVGGSGAYVITYGNPNRPSSERALVKYFKYDSSLHGEQRFDYNDHLWHSMINADLEMGRPILYTGSDSDGGHAFVLDGADVEGRYHFNWGWGGIFDGFFLIDSLNLGGGGIGSTSTYSFNMNQEAIFNVFPREVEVFDTVDISDTVCNNVETFVFYDYELPAESGNYVLKHRDTVFRLEVVTMNKRYAYFDPNGGRGSRRTVNYCPAQGVTMPENNFTNGDKVFVGWSTNASGNDVIYQPGDVADIRYNVLFYAIWRDSAELAAIGDVMQENAPRIWPNPVSGMLSVDDDGQEFSLSVFDAMGRLVMQSGHQCGTAKFDLGQLQPGVYMVRVNDKRGVYNSRVIKQ